MSESTIEKGLSQMECKKEVDKYQLEALLTAVFAEELAASDCGSNDNSTAPEGFLHYCDMGVDRTIVQNDYDHLVRIPRKGNLPCRFFSREGDRISSFEDILRMAEKAETRECTEENDVCTDRMDLHLYAAPAGRVFMFAPSYVGEIFQISHVKDSLGQPISLEVLSLDPRVFDIYNFFSADEAHSLIDKAVKETSPTYRLHRSTTGSATASIFNKRTSENAWDTHGTLAQTIKRRCLSVLGIDEYQESLTDGLQILRYNQSNAYTAHMDYLEDKDGSQVYDYESVGKGGNRFATILLYMSDLGEHDGGETAFVKADSPGKEHVPLHRAIQQLRDSGDASTLTPDSWEEIMAAQCRARLSVRPKLARAVLFYSQHPNGAEDKMSFHSGCPVLGATTKWAANLWVWNAPRPEFEGAPLKKDLSNVTKAESAASQQLRAVFRNSGKDRRFEKAELYFDEDGFFGKLGPKDPPISVNTYETHRWNVKVDGEILVSFYIDDQPVQEFTV